MASKTIFNRTAYRLSLLKRFEKLEKGTLFLKGGEETTRYDTDTDNMFRQESNFFYVTGVNWPSCSAAINLKTNEFVLFVPNLGDEYALWCGDYPTNEEFKEETGAHRVEYKENIKKVLVDEWKTEKLYTLRDTPQTIINISKLFPSIDNQALYRELTKCRLIKSEEEVEILKKVGKISSEAHKNAMKIAKSGINEAQLQATIEMVCKSHGCKHMAYIPIVAGDDRGATLHYVNNDKTINDGSLVLIDAGGELDYYASDITRTFPVNGKFSEKQKEIYQIVLKANKAVIQSMKPGVQWVDMHRLSERIIAEGLIKLGLLQGSLEEILQHHVQAAFFPHGLGHSLGLDVHDPPNKDGSFTPINEPGIKNLRIHTVLEKGVVLTVEPGIYFNKRLIDGFLKDEKTAKFMNKEKIMEYIDFGGVRIEDDLVVTENGVEVFSSDVPKEIDEIEKLMASN